MSTTIQQLFHKWATSAPDECLSTERDYKFKLRILPDVEKSGDRSIRRIHSITGVLHNLQRGFDNAEIKNLIE
ncbi:MAG: hypothetical protein V7K69_31575 [Nostoc sp.]|uniref:hypothetical protein n=1 Tax=Nostoc sp. TaxID=1180 RepID=UPI002FF7CC52